MPIFFISSSSSFSFLCFADSKSYMIDFSRSVNAHFSSASFDTRSIA